MAGVELEILDGERAECTDTFAVRLAAYLDEGGWEEALTAFASQRQEAFERYIEEMQVARPAGEHHHGLYEAYREFVELTDDMLQSFRESEGLSEDEFLDRCRLLDREGVECNGILDALLAATEYEQFVQFMLDFLEEGDTQEGEPPAFAPAPR
eukprot:TRINITY_DN77701_c0_g1_i1.p2 TRINITY_DN77701_c0_g1~~TRINITY_DN77701_c0_g1_i1.p2  ORF type:complete len:154 (-),score=38.54 TRINITY_DN77701_c0_g1_i1:289-750(-)